MAAESSKTIARLEARIKPEVKELWQQAADLEGRSLTDFVIATVQAEAIRVIEQHQRLKLSREDSQAFAAAILNPPPPNAALTAANQQGQGYGGLMLANALKTARTIATQIASTAVVVDAIDQPAKQFYLKYGFREFQHHPMKLYLPISAIELAE